MQTWLFPVRPIVPAPPKRSPAWEELRAEERAAVTNILARLIAKTVRPEGGGEGDEPGKR
jgi:hypothetical protein